jgi:hypothetical protein
LVSNAFPPALCAEARTASISMRPWVGIDGIFCQLRMLTTAYAMVPRKIIPIGGRTNGSHFSALALFAASSEWSLHSHRLGQ